MPVSKFFISDAIVYGFRTTFTQIRLIVFFALMTTGIVLSGAIAIFLLNMPLYNALIQLRDAQGLSDFVDVVKAAPSEFFATILEHWIILLISLFVALILLAWIITATAAITLEVYDKGKGSVTLFFNTLYFVPKILIATIIFFFVLFIGLILFVIPGIVWAVRSGPVFYLIVDKNAGVIEAFQKSFLITKGYFWPLLGWNMFYFLIRSMPAYFSSLILLPIYLFANVDVYRSLMDNYKE